MTPDNIIWKNQGHGRTTLTRQCKVCRAAKDARWRAVNKERYRVYHRDWNRRYRASLYLYRAIKDNGREIAEAVFD